MDAYRAIVDKRDQRLFLPRPLPDAALRRILQAAQRHEFDAGRCAQNMMVVAWSDFIGSCPAHLPEADLARLLDVPSEMVINRVIGFGYVDPARAAPPKSVARPRKPLDELVRWERWPFEAPM